MALVNCPECGHEKVSSLAEKCPNCGFPIKSYFRTAERISQKEYARHVKESARHAQKKRTNKAKVKWIPLLIIIGVAAIVIAIVANIVNTQRNNKKIEDAYEKDLSSAFSFNFTTGLDAIIEHEKNEYGHDRYHQDRDHDNCYVFYRFDEHYQVKCKHEYWFLDSDASLFRVYYQGNTEEKTPCEHIEPLTEALLEISSAWDENDPPLFNYMYGNLDGGKCKVEFSDYSIVQPGYLTNLRISKVIDLPK